ncbi:hypothetical protein JCM8115_003423 [Rhodotorula mucilaginosa]
MSGVSIPGSLQPSGPGAAILATGATSDGTSISSSSTAHEPVRAPPTAAETSAFANASERRRASFPACARCRRGKIKCVAGDDGQLPCAACVARGVGAMCTRADPVSSIYGLESTSVRQRKRRADATDEFGSGSGSSPATPFARSSSYPTQTESARVEEQSDGYGLPGSALSRPSVSPPLRSWQPSPAKPEPNNSFSPVPWSLALEGCKGPCTSRLRSKSAVLNSVLVHAVFVTQFCQLGFLHRPTFLHELQTGTGAHSPFLLASMLALSARLTPAIVKYFGSPRDATRFFLSRAHNLLVDGLYAPSLDRVQALYLLSLADTVERNAYRAKVMLELARSMAATLELDKSGNAETEITTANIEQEVRRRTWWCLQVEPTFETGLPRRSSANRPLPAVPLPMDEQEFLFGTSTHDPVYLDSEPKILQLDKPIRTSLLGLLVLSRALLSDALGECTDGVPSPNSVEGLQARLAVIQASFTPFQMPTASNSLAYRSQDLDVSFHELHLNLLATRILLLLRGLNAKPDANVEEKEAATKSKIDLAIDVADKVEGLLRSRPGLILPPDFAIYLLLAGDVLLPGTAATGDEVPDHVVSVITRILVMLEDAAGVWPVAHPWASAFADRYNTRVKRQMSTSPLPCYAAPGIEASATNAASTLAALATSTPAPVKGDSTLPPDPQAANTLLHRAKAPSPPTATLVASRPDLAHPRYSSIAASAFRPKQSCEDAGAVDERIRARSSDVKSTFQPLPVTYGLPPSDEHARLQGLGAASHSSNGSSGQHTNGHAVAPREG